MKKLKLLTALAVAGIVGMTAHATGASGFETINFKLTAYASTNDTAKLVKIKITNKDVLNQVEQEFGNVAITISGAKLALGSGGIFNGTGDIYVLNKTNGVVVDASNVNDNQYQLGFSFDHEATSAPNNGDKETTMAVGHFTFSNASGSTAGDLQGLAKVTETFKNNNSGDSESFKFTGTGNGEYHGTSAVVTGTISTSGKDILDIGLLP